MHYLAAETQVSNPSAAQSCFLVRKSDDPKQITPPAPYNLSKTKLPVAVRLPTRKQGVPKNMQKAQRFPI